MVLQRIIRINRIVRLRLRLRLRLRRNEFYTCPYLKLFLAPLGNKNLSVFGIVLVQLRESIFFANADYVN